ncbi:hypothetical protein SNEBB_004602 [Seison nebaliae]|nr:hypothetical protein SNEBB_004602 [Seison nebaliae]
MKKYEIEEVCEELEKFDKPKQHLEQHYTPPSLAVEIASYVLNNFPRKNERENVDCHLDLGIGTGILASAVSMTMETEYCLGVDIDIDALLVCRRNYKENLDEYFQLDLICCNVENLEKVIRNDFQFDICVMNPPFGTSTYQKKTNESGIDLKFLQMSMKFSDTIYSLHKSGNEEFLSRSCERQCQSDECVRIDVCGKVRFPIEKIGRRSSRYHGKNDDNDGDDVKRQKNMKNIEVDLIRLLRQRRRMKKKEIN